MFSLKTTNTSVAIIMYGPKGISEDKPFDFFNKLGVIEINAIIEDKNIIKGIDIQPNQKPITANNLASPNPIPSFFLICL